MQAEGECEGHNTMRLLWAIPATAVALAGCAGSANAGCPQEWANPPSDQPRNGLNNLLGDLATTLNPQLDEQRRQREAARASEEAARATYRALLQGGATEEVACAAALNPDFFRIVALQYLRPQR
jgi:hypothetical protein